MDPSQHVEKTGRFEYGKVSYCDNTFVEIDTKTLKDDKELLRIHRNDVCHDVSKKHPLQRSWWK